MDEIDGTLEKILFVNSETHFCVGELSTGAKGPPVVVAGALPGVQCGETLRLEGEWVNHPRFGRQFKVQRFEATLPATVHGIRKYLGSGLVKGIGKTYAGKIVAHFGADTMKVISEDSGRLREIPGIGSQRARQIKLAWEEQKAVREIMIFLQTYGISASRCLRLVRKYGNGAREMITANPYQLADEVDGIGFKTADRIARNLGLDTRGADRVEAGLLHVMKSEQDDGHTVVDRQRLIETAASLLEIEAGFLEPHLDRMSRGRTLAEVQPEVFQLPSLLRAEERIARALARVVETPSTLPSIRIPDAIVWATRRLGMNFAPEQESALAAAMEGKVTILTGGPGTGKTTILKALVEIVGAKKGRIRLASPTGRAAQRLSEAAGRKASTIHRLLEFDPGAGGFLRKEERPLQADLVIIDEASMLDTWLAASLFSALPAGAHLLLVGDVDQLPSVGPGRVLQDLMDEKRFVTVRLNHIFRQQQTSAIITTAHRILGGVAEVPQQAAREGAGRESDFRFVIEEEPEAAAARVIKICQFLLSSQGGSHDPMEVQVLAPMIRGVAGVGELNRRLQEALNPSTTFLEVGGVRFSVGDKVIQSRNNYDKQLFNGDVGRVEAVDPREGTLTARFNGVVVDFDRSDLLDLRLAYAISIHKSQGSEYRVVVMALLKQHFLLLRRNLVYTGITRGREKVIVVGDPAAYAMAVRNRDDGHRRTMLPSALKNSLAESVAGPPGAI